MPELPDVEVFRRRFEDAHFRGAIEETRVEDDRVLDRLSPGQLADAVRGQRLAGSRRHGKVMLAELSDKGALVFHFGMTGSLAAVEPGEDPPRYAQVLFAFDDGRRLAFLSRRKFGRVGYTDNPEEPAREETLGPDALALDRDGFGALVSGRRTALKSLLMDQARLSGIGNVYSDEILFQAGLHPKATAGDLEAETVDRLYDTMRRVLEQAIDLGAGDPDLPDRAPKDWLLPHRNKGGRCPRCGGELVKATISGRSAWLCPHCQAKDG